MAKSSLKSNVYSQLSSFKKEIRFFKQNSWFFAGSKLDLSNLNDYKTISVLNTPIVIYLTKKNEYKAFVNVCPHRGSLIKLKERGNGPLVCKYHFWSYDEEGKIKNIPLKKDLFTNKEAKEIFENSKLKQWNLEFCGNFIFISHSDNKSSLKNYLGSEYKKIELISNSIQKRESIQVWEWDANWKICVENSLDEYHAKFAHPSTFNKLIKLQPKYKKSNNVYSMNMPISDEAKKKWSKFNKYFSKRIINNNDYNHYHIFPMNSISSSYGVNFFVQTYMPINPFRTRVISELYIAKNISSKLSKNVTDGIKKAFLNFNNTVFDEDKILCESVHKGIISQELKHPIVSNYEKRISFFTNKLKRIYK